MAPQISYYILFGIISFTNCKPAYDQDTYGNVQKLLEEFTDQVAKFDIGLSHQEDSSRTHQDKARSYKYDEKSEESDRSSHDNDVGDRDAYLTWCKENTAKCRHYKWNLKRLTGDYDSVGEVADFLKEGEETIDVNGNYESNEYKSDSKESQNRDDNYSENEEIDTQNLRCSGNNCNRENRFMGDNIFKDNTLRCAGDSCITNIRDDNDKNDRNNLRCVGDRCGASQDYGNNLHCIGDRCGRSNNDRDDDDRNNRDNNDSYNDLRCVGDSCGTSQDDRNNLRCIGERCGRSYIDRDKNDRSRDNLRCMGNTCARSGYTGNGEVATKSQRRPKQNKIGDNFDAVVFNIVDLESLLSAKNNKLRAKLPESSKVKKPKIEAVVFDLDKQNDNVAFSKLIKRLLLQANESK